MDRGLKQKENKGPTPLNYEKVVKGVWKGSKERRSQ